LAALLRIAEGLDRTHQQNVARIEAGFKRGEVGLRITARGNVAEGLLDAQRSADLFESEFGVRMFIRQVTPSKRVA
jgi:exopolyphosphatase/guanosine-5'-triphosphate,3'-diphosphate pyrophosphatase